MGVSVRSSNRDLLLAFLAGTAFALSLWVALRMPW
jgi:hypothetical protein